MTLRRVLLTCLMVGLLGTAGCQDPPVREFMFGDPVAIPGNRVGTETYVQWLETYLETLYQYQCDLREQVTALTNLDEHTAPVPHEGGTTQANTHTDVPTFPLGPCPGPWPTRPPPWPPE
jgi:hypothetical protein